MDVCKRSGMEETEDKPGSMLKQFSKSTSGILPPAPEGKNAPVDRIVDGVGSSPPNDSIYFELHTKWLDLEDATLSKTINDSLSHDYSYCV